MYCLFDEIYDKIYYYSSNYRQQYDILVYGS